MKKTALSVLIIGMLCRLPAYADWNPTPGELSAAGALSTGAGILSTLATPLVLGGELSTNPDPLDASANTLRHAGRSLSHTGLGIVFLLEGTRKGLSELTEDSLHAAGTLTYLTMDTVASGIPKVTIEFPDKTGSAVKKSIPLVVRKEYVQMHERVEITP